MSTIDPYEDLSLETVVEPGDIVKFEQPIGGDVLGDPTDYTHGIVTEVVSRYSDRARKGAPERLGVALYAPSATDKGGKGLIDLETGNGSGIASIVDYLADELTLLYKPGRETGYSPHNVEVMELIDHYSNAE